MTDRNKRKKPFMYLELIVILGAVAFGIIQLILFLFR
jgi:hypothetical protein